MKAAQTIPSNAQDELVVIATLFHEGQAALDIIRQFHKTPLELFYESHTAELFKRLAAGIDEHRPMIEAVMKKHSTDVPREEIAKIIDGGGWNMPLAGLETYYLPGLVSLADDRRLMKAMDDLATKPAKEKLAEVKNFKPTEIPSQGNRVEQALNGAISGWEFAHANPGVHTGIDSGLSDLDHITWGWQPENLIVVGGRPSQGKSALLAGFALHASLNLKVSVLFFSLESSATEIVRRMACSSARVRHQTMREGDAKEGDFTKLTAAIDRIRRAPLLIDDTAGLTISQMRNIARAKVKDNGVKLILVDYIQKVRADVKNEKRTYEVAQVSEGLKTMAKELNLPVIAAAQLNREPDKSNYKKGDNRDEAPPARAPRLADLGDSGQIERDADVVVLIWHTSEKSRLMISKNRDGETRNVEVVFLREITRFESVAKVTHDDMPQQREMPNYDNERF